MCGVADYGCEGCLKYKQKYWIYKENKMTKEEIFDYYTFVAGLGFLIAGIGYGYILWQILLGVFFIYFSEVVLEFFKLKEHQRDLKAIKKETDELKKIPNEEKKERKEKSIKYKTTIDRWEKERKLRKKWDKKHRILAFFRNVFEDLRRFLWYNLDEHPATIKLWIKTKYQRAVKVWAVSDAWGFDWYLSRVIIEGCEWLKKNKHGIPMSALENIEATGEYGEHTDEEFKEAEKNWNNILDKIIKTFKTTQKIQDNHWHYQKSVTYNDKEADRIRRINKEMRKERRNLHVMTKKECKEYEEGWMLFQTHYFGLQD